MTPNTSPLTMEKDPLSELYDVASALRFLEDAFDGHDQAGAPIRATGAAYVAGLMGRRVNAIACDLWDKEHSAPLYGDKTPPNPSTSCGPARDKPLPPRLNPSQTDVDT